MATTNVDRKVTKRGHLGGLGSLPAAASTILPHGRPVFVDATNGMGTNTSNSGANPFYGIAHTRVDNSGGANGDLDVECWIEDRFELEGSGFTPQDVGKKVYLADNGDNLTKTATSASLVGTITEYISATKVEVRINPHAA